LLYGSYEVIVRAYDKAGNVREQSQKFEITDSWLWFVGQDGIMLPFVGQVKWKGFLPVMGLFVLALLFMAYVIRRHYQHHDNLVQTNALPDSLKAQLDELNKYRSRYGKIAAMFLLAIVFSWFVSYSAILPARAEELVPPVVGTYSSNIKDDELFFVTGRTTEPNQDVVVHLQSMVDGASFDFTTTSDKRGDWTYRHSSFLAGGKYILWAHTKSGDQLSVPSPQVTMDVKPVAIHWGGSRVTYQTVYLVSIVVLFVVVVALVVFIVIAWVLARRRRREFAHTVRLTEEGLKHGFLSLKRDLEAELAMIQRATMGGELAGEANVRAQQLRDDLKNIEDVVGREISAAESMVKLNPQ
jgi:cytochrome c-type biogenesis protein CcmH/NrfF